MTRIRVFVFDESKFVCAVISLVVERDELLSVVGVECDPERAVSFVLDEAPDVIVFDIKGHSSSHTARVRSLAMEHHVPTVTWEELLGVTLLEHRGPVAAYFDVSQRVLCEAIRAVAEAVRKVDSPKYKERLVSCRVRIGDEPELEMDHSDDLEGQKFG